MKNRKQLISGYMLLLTEDDVVSYQTPNGAEFVKDDDSDYWYNQDNPNEVLNVKELAARCTDEELQG